MPISLKGPSPRSGELTSSLLSDLYDQAKNGVDFIDTLAKIGDLTAMRITQLFLVCLSCFLFAACLQLRNNDDDDGLDDGLICLADNECESSNCECEDFNCTVRVCAEADCLCGYGTSGTCVDPMDGLQDPEDCDQTGQVCGSTIDNCESD